MARGKLRLASLAIAAAALCFDPARAAGPPPVEAYAELPFQHGMRLSPDGTKVAVIIPHQGRNSLAIFSVQKDVPPIFTPTGDFEPNWFVWKSNQRLIASLRMVSTTRLRIPTVDTRLLAIDADFQHARDMVRSAHFDKIPQLQDRIVSLLPGDPDHILVEMTDDSTGEINVQRASLNGERPVPILHEHEHVSGWMCDANGVVRLGVRYKGSTREILTRNSKDDDWHVINSSDANTGDAFHPVAFSSTDPNRLYVRSDRVTGRDAIWEVDTKDGTFIRAIAADDKTGVEPITRNDELIGYERNGDGTYLDPAWEADYRGLVKVLPGYAIRLIDRTDDGSRVLLRAAGGNQPVTYWVLDRTTGKALLSPIAQDYPKIEPSQVAPAKQVWMTSRDGLHIPVIVTLPVGHESGPIPFVVLPHGGPTGRDYIGFWFLTQFIASRGYGVMQPQFRGSTGFGQEFEHAGLQQWGLKMQDDVTDATRWLIDQNMADPSRICIVGWSYGGYASLMGAVKEPALYKCSVAIAPVTDLRRLTRDLAKFQFKDVNIPRIGEDRDVLEQTSPSDHADRIRIPVLLIHGRKDYTVPVDHSEEMEAALKAAGKSVQALYFDNADHYLVRQEDRLAMLKAVETFLATNLGPGAVN